MRKKFLPFALPSIFKEEISAVNSVLRSGWITTGNVTKKFEEEFANFIGAKYALALNSCTAALHLALDAIGLQRGDEVIVPTMTFAATAEAVTYFGAKPVFVDCDKNTFNINTQEIEKNITKRTKAIMPVHIAGQPCDMDEIKKIARKHNLKIIEDAAHALPAKYKGRFVGKIGDLTCFSFYPTKSITTGEGGMVTTSNKKWAERIKIMRLHGLSREAWSRYSRKGSAHYRVLFPGFKYNLTDIASALGREQLKKCDLFFKKRAKIAEIYNRNFKNIKEIQIPYIDSKRQHAWHLYIIKLNLDCLKISRDEFMEEMKKRKIGVSLHFIPLHLQPAYKKYIGKGDKLPLSEKVSKQIVSLPIYPKMAKRDIIDVIEAVKDIIQKNRK